MSSPTPMQIIRRSPTFARFLRKPAQQETVQVSTVAPPKVIRPIITVADANELRYCLDMIGAQYPTRQALVLRFDAAITTAINNLNMPSTFTAR